MSGFSINDAISKLGIYRSEADALDALDGKKDEKISKDIFTLAQEALKNAEAEYSEDNKGKALDMTRWTNVAKCLGRTIAQKMGFEGFVHSSDENENIGEWLDNDKHEQIAELADEAVAYAIEHKTLEGFRFTGIPNGVTNIKISLDEYYGNSENDIVTFDNDGKAVVEKVIDGIAVEIHYTLNDTNYAIGGTLEDIDLSEPENNDTAQATNK